MPKPAAAICWKVAPLIQRDSAFCSFSRAWSSFCSFSRAWSGLREEIAREFPVPKICGFPDELPVGLVDYIWDASKKKWYTMQLRGRADTNVSLADLADGTNTPKHLHRHRFGENTIEDVVISPQDIIVEIKEVGGTFRSRRKLATLALAGVS